MSSANRLRHLRLPSLSAFLPWRHLHGNAYISLHGAILIAQNRDPKQRSQAAAVFANESPLVYFGSAGDGGLGGEGFESLFHCDAEFFENRIRPLLVNECYRCHSATSEKIKGDLLLDTRAGLLKGGDSKQPSIVPGDPDASPLIKAVRWLDADLQMPPKKKLTAEQIADLVTWIKMGALDPREGLIVAPVKPRPTTAPAHWSFQPIKDPALPSTRDRDRRGGRLHRGHRRDRAPPRPTHR